MASILEQSSPTSGWGDAKVYINACNLKSLCYNADTSPNKLSHKGLLVNQTFRLFRTVRLICLLAVVATVGFPAESLAQTTRRTTSTKKTTTTKKRLALKPAQQRVAATVRSRRTVAARAKAVQQARQAREVAEPRFKLDDSGALVPDVRAEAAIIYNPETGKVLWETNSTNQRSIASITKVMTAVVFLENNPDLTETVVVTPADVRAASTTYLRSGYVLTKSDVLHLMLIASDNAAARVLARVSPYGTEAFIRRMTEKARELGLTSTSYADPSGLLSDNVSSAYDMAKLITYVSGDERIASVMRKQYYSVAVGRQTIQVHSTNRLVMQGDVDVQAGKTGFISKAGYCLATLLRLPQGGPEVAVVVLGAKSNAGRFMETRHLFDWLSSKASDMFATTTAAPVTAAAAPASN
jgi:serine-type D-Ala-D-Ala endopeptidase (penicillin-binding protein 7)